MFLNICKLHTVMVNYLNGKDLCSYTSVHIQVGFQWKREICSSFLFSALYPLISWFWFSLDQLCTSTSSYIYSHSPTPPPPFFFFAGMFFSDLILWYFYHMIPCQSGDSTTYKAPKVDQMSGFCIHQTERCLAIFLLIFSLLLSQNATQRQARYYPKEEISSSKLNLNHLTFLVGLSVNHS